ADEVGSQTRLAGIRAAAGGEGTPPERRVVVTRLGQVGPGHRPAADYLAQDLLPERVRVRQERAPVSNGEIPGVHRAEEVGREPIAASLLSSPIVGALDGRPCCPDAGSFIDVRHALLEVVAA